MKKHLVYDLPLRLFHWLFAGLFVFAFAIAKIIDDDSPIFTYHMLAGIMLSYVVSLRLIWGFLGTRYSQFRSFSLRPSELVNYFREILSGGKKRWSGHNPASSWAALVMFALALSLGGTGYLMSTGYKENFEDIHEILANAFAVVVLLHIAGIFLHFFRHRDGIALTMISGVKAEVSENEAITNNSPIVAAGFLVLVAGFSIYLASGFESSKQTLNVFGTSIQLGENEGESEGQREGESEGQANDDNDD